MSKNKFSKRLAASLIAAATIGSSGVLSSLTNLPVHAADTDNYAKLLQYSMYFYDGNMCGDDVDSASAFDWRGDCHTGDEVVGDFFQVCSLTQRIICILEFIVAPAQCSAE